MKILIVIPPNTVRGGISGHFRGLKPFFSSDIKYHHYFQVSSTILNKLILPINLLWMLCSIIRKSPDKILINASLKAGIFSKLVYCSFCQFLGYKVILFIHGWNEKEENLLDNKYLKYTLNKCHSIIILSPKFKVKMRNKGINTSILFSTTKVDNFLVEGFNIQQRTGNIKKFLFVSRLEKGKGVYETLEVFKLLQTKFNNIEFTVVGDGSESSAFIKKVKDENIKNVRITGNLEGEMLKKEFQNADFFFLLSYSEGLPAALLEAMAFGLPVATRPVGGIKDLFEDKNIGILSSELDPKFYYLRILELMRNKNEVKKISHLNYKCSQDNFLASNVAKRFEVAIKEDTVSEVVST